MAYNEPVYIKTIARGQLKEKIRQAWKILKSCILCPRECRVDRLSGETGICKTGKNARVSSFNPHFGEESPLAGTNGSGTIFFTHCNLMCLFCQNYEISHHGYGEDVSLEQLAKIMLILQDKGCHNINFVTPSHVVPQILSALEIAVEKGLRIPLIYNTGSYDKVSTLKILEDVFDIYMPDFKFWNPELAKKACDAQDYPETARQALIEMHRQVGDLKINESGIAEHGVLIRHLVLPDMLAGTPEIMKFIAEISTDSYVNIMPQYRPCGKAGQIKGLDAFLLESEYDMALKAARDQGILRLDKPHRIFRFVY
ncbi:Radical SAM domain-containing protein [Desulfonema limicola]|uniref:Radical SAM domain-containing protein n=1 Tax=Desulfonema limicola TaxID=45656 RepID=A0A975BE11_9BACT|nr:radical SAM protein [Desulfonema limicola]QTA83657.1 Radical SAM domain-containing protein [Desulfonema limicola]